MNFEPLRHFMDKLTGWRIPGNSIIVSIDGKEVFKYQSGYENLERGIRMNEGKLFNIFSCSKPITVVAAMQLYEKGLFLLDDPLCEYLPEYEDMYVSDGNGSVRRAKNPITLRHLFTMTAGFNYDLSANAFDVARRLTDGKMNTRTVIRCLAKEPLSFEPGERWQYSLCHDVLAAAVEEISGKKFRDYVSENIFKPLGMNDSYYHYNGPEEKIAELYRYDEGGEDDPVKQQASGFSRDGGQIVNVGKGVRYILGSEYDSGGAGITTSLEDYSKFAVAMSLGGRGKNGEKILSESTIDLIRTNQLSASQLADFNWPQLSGYGYGLGVRTMIDPNAAYGLGNIGEFGWGGAAGATLLVDPEIKLSVAYAHHMLNQQESYYQPRLRDAVYQSIRG